MPEAVVASVGSPGEDEEKVAEAVQIAQHLSGKFFT